MPGLQARGLGAGKAPDQEVRPFLQRCPPLQRYGLAGEGPGDVHIFELGKECLGNPNGGGRRTRTDAALRDGRLTGLMAGASRRVPWRRACGSAELGKEEAG